MQLDYINIKNLQFIFIFSLIIFSLLIFSDVCFLALSTRYLWNYKRLGHEIFRECFLDVCEGTILV